MRPTVPASYEYTYGPSDVVVGPGCVDSLSDQLDRYDVDRAMIVCGSTVGSTPEVIDPVRASLGERLVAVFDETTAEKSAQTALDGVDRIAEYDVDGIVALGGGSSIDVARAMSVFKAEAGDPLDHFAWIGDDGGIRIPNLEAPKLPVIAITTTFSGAELTCAAGVNFEEVRSSSVPDDARQGPIYDPAVLPKLLAYDPDLYAATPESVLAASAMNGFNHGIETLYSRHANPITDATAIHGLGLAQDALPAAVAEPDDTESMIRAITGIILSSYGFVDPESDGNKYSVIHAFGHIISRYYDVQQGVVHGITAPHVLEYLFDDAAVRPDAMAMAFDVDADGRSTGAVADEIVEAVSTVRDGLGLPARLRTIEGLGRADFPKIANGITNDVGLANGPPGLDLSEAAIRSILEAAW